MGGSDCMKTKNGTEASIHKKLNTVLHFIKQEKFT